MRATDLVPEARHQVVVHHADGLHVGVHDRAADELEAALLEILAERVGFFRGRGQLLHAVEAVLNRPAIDEAPDVFVERAELFLHIEKQAGVGDRRPRS